MTGDSGEHGVTERGAAARQWLQPVAALNRFAGLSVMLPEVTDARTQIRERWAVPIEGYRLLVDTDVQCELSEWLPECAVPNTPRWLTGVVNLRGTLVPVFDLRQLFPGDGGRGRTRKLLFIVGSGESAAAMVVEGLPYRQRLDGEVPEAEVPELPAALAAKVSAAYRRNGVWWLDCDLPGLLRELGTQAAGA
ncbi:MAG: chemotaxis protein CheW [Aquisalimonadaceae bacterium]